MSSGGLRNISRKDIESVQNLIELCLQLYLNKKEVVKTLMDKAKIEPVVTELVWQKLEEENPEFFKAYHARVMVKQQIVTFNELLEKQVELMQNMQRVQKIQPAERAASPMLQQIPPFPAMEHGINPAGLDSICHQTLASTTVEKLSLSMNQRMPMSDEMLHWGTPALHLPSNMLLAQNPSMDMLQAMNKEEIKSELMDSGLYDAAAGFFQSSMQKTSQNSTEIDVQEKTSNSMPHQDSLQQIPRFPAVDHCRNPAELDSVFHPAFHPISVQQIPHFPAMEHSRNPAELDSIFHPKLSSSNEMAHSGTTGLPSGMPSSQNHSMDILLATKGEEIKSEHGSSNSPVSTFGGEGDVQDSHSTVGEFGGEGNVQESHLTLGEEFLAFVDRARKSSDRWTRALVDSGLYDVAAGFFRSSMQKNSQTSTATDVQEKTSNSTPHQKS